MSILFLDPLVLMAYGVLGAWVWVVWTGGARWWFGRDGWWTLAVWPFPLVTGVLPLLAAVIAALLRQVGLGAEGGTMAGAIYLGAYVVPWAWLSLSPPRWVLPRWARARLTRLPRASDAPEAGAIPALHAWRGRGHAARSRWVWSVDAVAGYVWVDDGVLRFRAVDDPDDPGENALLDDLDDELVSGLQLHMGDEFHLASPRGGWWSRRSLDVDLAVLDRWRSETTHRRSRAGLVTLEVDRRRPVRLWVADVATVTRALTQARGPAATA